MIHYAYLKLVKVVEMDLEKHGLSVLIYQCYLDSLFNYELHFIYIYSFRSFDPNTFVEISTNPFYFGYLYIWF